MTAPDPEPDRRVERADAWATCRRWLTGLAVLGAMAAAGELAVRLTGLPLPGTVVGLVVLAGVLGATRARARWRPLAAATYAVARPLTRHLQLFFVPAAVGIASSVSRVADHLVPVALAVAGSFLVVLVVIGRLTQSLLARGERP